MPSTSTLVMTSGSSILDAAPDSVAASTPAAICSGIEAVAANMPMVSAGRRSVTA